MITRIINSGIKWKLSLVLLCTLTAVFLEQDASYADQGEGPFQPGRALRVTIWQEPDLSGDYSIDSNGYVILPLIGRINVSRFSQESLESYLTNEYSNYLRSPIIMVEPLIRVGVLGEVKQPGLFRVNPDSPLWDVIDMSGGPTAKANIKGIKVIRNGKVVSKDLLSAFENGESLSSIGIESGDQVYVPPSRRPMEWRTMVSLMSIGVATVSLILRNRR